MCRVPPEQRALIKRECRMRNIRRFMASLGLACYRGTQQMCIGALAKLEPRIDDDKL